MFRVQGLMFRAQGFLLGPCAQVRALWRFPKNGRMSHLTGYCLVLSVWGGGAVRRVPNVQEILVSHQFQMFGILVSHHFHPVRELHAPSPFD